jgi:hypothetical protein
MMVTWVEVFWVVTPRILLQQDTDVSEDHAAFIFRVRVFYRNTTSRPNPELESSPLWKRQTS